MYSSHFTMSIKNNFDKIHHNIELLKIFLKCILDQNEVCQFCFQKGLLFIDFNIWIYVFFYKFEY